MITNNNEKHKVRTLAALLNSLVACIVNFQTLIKMRLRTKSAVTIEQKGVAQLLQIEEVQLKSTRRCGFSQSSHAQEASIIQVFYTV